MLRNLNPSYIAGGNINKLSHFGKLAIPQKVKQSYHLTLQFYF